MSDLAPSFTQKPQLSQEDDGNRLVFQCQLVGHPMPDISWFREETQLFENERTSMSVKPMAAGKYLVALEIDQVVETDGGLYKVKARNKLGEVAASISLNFSRKLLLLLLLSSNRQIYLFKIFKIIIISLVVIDAD